ncbi:hypothetical protein SB778_03870 [Paraburkholderia sp. SIMBA_050]
MSRGEIPNHKSHLSEAGQRHYIDQETILSTHPVRQGRLVAERNFAAYDAAAVLVGERHAKGDLVDLVGHLLATLDATCAAPNAAVPAIQFALEADEGMTWLRLWNEGEFEACRREWPEAPDDCYIGADQFFTPTPEGTAR